MDAAKHPMMNRTTPPNPSAKNNLVQNTNSAKIEKPCFFPHTPLPSHWRPRKRKGKGFQTLGWGEQVGEGSPLKIFNVRMLGVGGWGPGCFEGWCGATQRNDHRPWGLMDLELNIAPHF